MFKQFRYDEAKNERLLRERGLSFKMVIESLNNGGLVDTYLHHNQEKHPQQEFYVVEIEGYLCVVPFDEFEDHIVLRTVYRSRKAMRDFAVKPQKE